jgi:hypothetical protein
MTALVTRSRLSFMAVSGKPTTEITPSRPQPAFASICTSKASTPTTAAEKKRDFITFDRYVVI